MTREGFERLFTMAGLEVLDESLHDAWEAPQNRGETRAQAIDRWLAAYHGGEPSVILDDELSGTGLSRSVHEKRGRLVLCIEDVGLHRGHLALIRDALTKAPSCARQGVPLKCKTGTGAHTTSTESCIHIRRIPQATRCMSLR